MVKAIIFDCFGVLTADTWQEFLDSLPPGADKEAARKAHRKFDAGLITKEECSEKIKKATGRKFVELDDAQTSSYPKNTQLLGYIRELRERGYKTSVLSNTSSNWLREKFLSREEQKLFNDYLLSYNVGLIKPDPKMFLMAAERLGVSPREAVLIDDKSRYNDEAEKLGFKNVTYQNLGQMKSELEQILSA